MNDDVDEKGGNKRAKLDADEEEEGNMTLQSLAEGEDAPSPAPSQKVPEDNQDPPDVASLIARNPDQLPELLRYVAQLAKHAYSTTQQDQLKREYEAFRDQEQGLIAEKDALLASILKKELG